MEPALSPSSIQSMLRTLELHQAQAAAGVQAPPPLNTGGDGFGAVVERALEAVHTTQQKASALREQYERGEPVPLTDVVMQMQKASLAFEATLQVRNKVMKAYEDILNMPL